MRHEILSTWKYEKLASQRFLTCDSRTAGLMAIEGSRAAVVEE
jgi:hypothetical protein